MKWCLLAKPLSTKASCDLYENSMWTVPFLCFP